jgi:exopolyphosphatase/guanosine-5'-triphosphate,3'-diphosphate pyrophosphatase
MTIPRWEWRRFGTGLERAERQLRALEPFNTQNSVELYILGPGANASVKLRDERLDIKQLVTIGKIGVEQWRPILKAVFPLSEADLTVLREALHVPLEIAAQERATQHAFVEAIRHAGPQLRAVAVAKHRVHYRLGGCMAELSQLRTEAGTLTTIAVESPDAERVVATVRALGLDDGPNTSVPRALEAAVGYGARRFAVLDVGTNSVKFHIGECAADGSWRTVLDRADVTRLGEGLERSGRLGVDAIERTVRAIEGMGRDANRAGVEAIAAVGTAGLRIAPNASDLVAAVDRRCHISIDVIDGEEEARLAYAAARSALGRVDGTLAVFDTGGGSSQFTVGRGDEIAERFSVDVGAVRLTERYGLDRPVGSGTLNLALAAIATGLTRIEALPHPDAIIGMGGAITNLTAVKLGLTAYDRDRVHGTVLDRTEIDRQIALYRTRDASQRREIVGLQPARAEVILAGACIVRVILALLGRDSFVVSDRGLRHGVLMERFGMAAASPRPSSRPPVSVPS